MQQRGPNIASENDLLETIAEVNTSDIPILHTLLDPMKKPNSFTNALHTSRISTGF
jgi:hypothetical protein